MSCRSGRAELWLARQVHPPPGLGVSVGDWGCPGEAWAVRVGEVQIGTGMGDGDFPSAA